MRAMSFMLFGVSPLDVTTWTASGVVVLAACLAAGYPAARRRRAARPDDGAPGRTVIARPSTAPTRAVGASHTIY